MGDLFGGPWPPSDRLYAFNGAGEGGGLLGPLLYAAAKCFLLQISSHLRWHVHASFAGSLYPFLSLSLFKPISNQLRVILDVLLLLSQYYVNIFLLICLYVMLSINGSQLAKMKKRIPDMSLP